VRWIVPFAPGGPTDVVVRVVAPKLSERIGQAVLIENRAGAAGNIGTELAARAAPDGYTLQNTSGSTFQNAMFTARVEYDVRKAFTPIVQLTISPSYMAFYPGAPFRTLAEMLADARINPGKLNFGSSGVGSGAHLAGELLADMAGVKLTHIPYKGAPQGRVAVMARECDFMFDGLLATLPLFRAGKLRALGVTYASAMLPDMPVIGASLPGYEWITHQAVFAPVHTPSTLAQRLHREVTHVLDRADVRDKGIRLGTELRSSAPGDVTRMMTTETSRMREALRKNGVTAE